MMYSDNKKIRLHKYGIIALGMIVVGLGTYSHFTSVWMKGTSWGMKLYDVCELIDDDVERCPNIIMERYFVGVGIVCLTISFLGVFAKMKDVDFRYHALAALLLISGGALYILSAKQIADLLDESQDFEGEREIEKYLAGALGIILGLLYGDTARAIINASDYD